MLVTTLIQIALALNTSPVDICTVISFETAGTFSTSIQGPKTKYGKAVGLIQFMPATAKELGTSTKELSSMNLEQQSKYVVKYLQKRKYKAKHDGNDLKRLYSTIFCGNSNFKRCLTKDDGYNSFNNIIEVKMKPHMTKCHKLLGVN